MMPSEPPIVAKFRQWASNRKERAALMSSSDANDHQRVASAYCGQRRQRRGKRRATAATAAGTRGGKRSNNKSVAKGCTWGEFHALQDAMKAPFARSFDHSNLKSRILIRQLREHGASVEDCARLPNLPTPEEFMGLVVASKPVVFEGVADHWPAIDKWTTGYLTEHLRGTPVVLSASPHGYFDSPENASIWGGPHDRRPRTRRSRRRTVGAAAGGKDKKQKNTKKKNQKNKKNNKKNQKNKKGAAAKEALGDGNAGGAAATAQEPHPYGCSFPGCDFVGEGSDDLATHVVEVHDDGYEPEEDVVIARPGHVSTTFENFVELLARARGRAHKLYLEYFPLMALLNPLTDPNGGSGGGASISSVGNSHHGNSDRNSGSDQDEDDDDDDDDDDDHDDDGGDGDESRSRRRAKRKQAAARRLRQELIGDLGMLSGGDWAFANFLVPRFRLIWMGSAGTVGSLHFDRNENLMAVVRGAKEFVLVDPGQTLDVYGGTPLRSASIEARLDPATGDLSFARPAIDFGQATNGFNSYSPVNMSDPDFAHFPRYRNVRPTVCRVNEGDVIYVPSHWWHEVRSSPDSDDKAVGINYFFEPWYERLGHDNKAPALIRNKMYDHLADGGLGGLGLVEPCAADTVCFRGKVKV
eukprot:g376.t1